MASIFDNEFTCDVCQCTYIDAKAEHKTRCKAHRHLPDKVEEEVKYLHKDISVQALADRIEELELNVALLMETQNPKGYKKICEDCGKEFTASAPNTKKCPVCKGKAN